MTLTEFLLTRITEDEADAWRWCFDWGGNLEPMKDRALAECEAKRQLIRMAYAHGATVDCERGCCHDAEALQAGGRPPVFDGDEFEPLPDDCLGARVAHEMLVVIAMPYADHPDYRESWRV